MTDENREIHNILDIVKGLCCLLIIGSHCLPIFESDYLNYYYGQWFFRFCVPFFFVSTGFFFDRMDAKQKKKYIIRIAFIYLIATFLYLPFILGSNVVRELVFGYHHLWYLLSLFVGLILFFVIDKIGNRMRIVLSILFLLVGVILDEWHRFFSLDAISKISGYVRYVGGCRNGLFFAFPMITIGASIKEQKYKLKKECLIFLVSLILGFVEATFLYISFGDDVTNDLTFFGWIPAIPLFIISMNFKIHISKEKTRNIRKIMDIAYIVHIWVVKFVLDVLKIQFVLGYAIVVIITLCLSYSVFYIIRYIKRRFATQNIYRKE